MQLFMPLCKPKSRDSGGWFHSTGSPKRHLGRWPGFLEYKRCMCFQQVRQEPDSASASFRNRNSVFRATWSPLDMPLIGNFVTEDFDPSELKSHALPWLGGALALSPIIYYSVMAVYNIYFHPLSKYPGPKSWSATPFPYAIKQLQGTCPKDTAEL